VRGRPQGPLPEPAGGSGPACWDAASVRCSTGRPPSGLPRLRFPARCADGCAVHTEGIAAAVRPFAVRRTPGSADPARRRGPFR
jgi:hypothetical protein